MSFGFFEDDVLFQQRLLKSAGLYDGLLDGDWGPITDAAFREFVARADKIGRAEGAVDAQSARNVRTLQLPAQRAARRLVLALVARGIDARVISGTRSYEEQNRLFAQGRFGNPGKIVTKSRGGQSHHNFGIAWDIGIFENGQYLTTVDPYELAASFGLAPGVEWGGNWSGFVDRPHYQLGTGLKITDVRSRFEDGKPYFDV